MAKYIEQLRLVVRTKLVLRKADYIQIHQLEFIAGRDWRAASLARVLRGEIRQCERYLRVVLECTRVETLPECVLFAAIRIEVPNVIQAVEG